MYNIFAHNVSDTFLHNLCFLNEKWLYIYMLPYISLKSVLFKYLDIIIFDKLPSTCIHAVV